jgi:hypothetical protein
MNKFLLPIEILSKYENIARLYNLTPQSLGWLVRMKILNGVSGKNCYLISETSFVNTFKLLIERDKKQVNNINI